MGTKARLPVPVGVRGSAFLMALGVISVLILIVIGFSKTNVARRFSTRLMSNEKKAEALAEAALDLALRKVKDGMNNDGDNMFYPYFRTPLEMARNDMGSADYGKTDVPILLGSLASHVLDASNGFLPAGLEPLESLINELGGGTHVPVLKVEVGFLQAGAFSARIQNYQVSAVSIPHAKAIGEGNGFLDDISQGVTSVGTADDWIAEQQMTFGLPTLTNNDQHDVRIDGFGGYFIEAWVKLKKTPPLMLDVQIYIRIGLDTPLGFVPFMPTIDHTFPVDFEELFERYINFDPYDLTLRSVLKIMMNNSSPNLSVGMSANQLEAAIGARYGDVATILGVAIPGGSAPFGSKPKVVEKGGTLRLKAEVEYLPNGPGGPRIRRVLLADRDFKVSDCQPPAPEYTFFAANSEIINEEGSMGLPVTINLSKSSSYTPPAMATFTLHHIPEKDYGKLDGMSGVAATDRLLVPGMVRINSNADIKIHTFLGTRAYPETTEYNFLCPSTKITPPFKLVPMFQWHDRGTPLGKDRIVHFPVVSSQGVSPQPQPKVGLKALKELLSFCDALEAPTLLFGLGHFEYPLGLRAEGRLIAQYAQLIGTVEPIGQILPDFEISEFNLVYTNEETPYGLYGYPPTKDAGNWDPNLYSNMPAYLYSTLQYAKKASEFYEDEAAFKAVYGGATWDIKGVIYVKGDLNINSEVTLKGKGLIVVKGSIILDAKVLRDAASKTVVGLIARNGSIDIRNGCTEVHAPLYSNAEVTSEGGHNVVIHGNLVVNKFVRNLANGIEVEYVADVCRITPMVVQRDVGKYEPARYYVSLGKNWQRFEYAKN